MEPEKFENSIKQVLAEREIKPSSASWEKLEQRLKTKKKKRPYLLWTSSAAAIAVVFFILGSYFNAPVATEEPQVVEESVSPGILEEKNAEPGILQVIASEEEVFEEKAAGKTPSRNAIFEAPVKAASEEKSEMAFSEGSEPAFPRPSAAPEAVALEDDLQPAKHKFQEVPTRASEVSDTEIEALLLLANAELKTKPSYTVSSDDLLHQVEYELDQSFRQKVFEVVKEGLSKARTAVANRDF